MAQAYHQTPWRLQLQWIGLFVVGLVLVALIAGLYLSVTAQTAAAGVEIQTNYETIDRLQRQIANHRNQLAILTSAKEMEKRARELGFEKPSRENIRYMVVPNYSGRQIAAFAPVTYQPPQQPLLKPGYTQSLWEWLFQGMIEVSKSGAGSFLP